MIRYREVGLFNAYAFTLAAVVSLCFWGCLLFFNAFAIRELVPLSESYFAYNLISIGGLLLQLYPIEAGRLNLLSLEPAQNFRLAVSQTLHIAGALTVMLVLTKDLTISRLFLIAYLVILPLALYVSNATLPRILSRLFFSGGNQTPALLIGQVRRASRVRRWLRRLESYGVQVVGFLVEDEDARKRPVHSVPVVGHARDLNTILQKLRIETVILLDIPEDQALLDTIIEVTNQRGVRLIVLNNLAEIFRHPLQYYRQFGVDFIALRQEPLQDPLNRVAKRAFDVALASLVVIFVLPPLALLVWLIHRTQSPGPLFYHQCRAGIQNRRFQILKFRTMHVANGDTGKQASEADERVFALGRLLRKTSMDEIPQFLNVLRGEMSVVGPRPHMIEHNDQFAQVMASYHIRTFVKPGVTGLAQVRGYRGEARTEEDIRQRVVCDIEYIEQWSLFWDLSIVVKTAWQVVFPPRSAY
ncbi:MAG: exopolysaccharide biosynthesis polyprenyl glycosylphosphotransferase [Chthoniobacterales bacterium]